MGGRRESGIVSIHRTRKMIPSLAENNENRVSKGVVKRLSSIIVGVESQIQFY